MGILYCPLIALGIYDPIYLCDVRQFEINLLSTLGAKL